MMRMTVGMSVPEVIQMGDFRILRTMTHAAVNVMPAASVYAVQQHRQEGQTSKKHGHRTTPVQFGQRREYLDL